VLDRALRLARFGFCIFPLKDGGKTPRIKGFTDLATTEEAQIKRWWRQWPHANIGIATSRHADGGALLAFDIDAKEGRHGEQTFAMFCEKHALALPATYIQTTPTGGRHVIFRVPEPLRQGAGVLGEGLDTRSGGGYVVGSGSIIEGASYTDNDASLADAPREAIALFSPWQKVLPQVASDTEVEDGGLDYGRAVHYLREVAPLPQQGSRNSTAYAVCCTVRDFGLSAEQAKAVVVEHWLPRGDALDESEVDAVLRSVYTYAKKPAGTLSIEARGEVPEAEEDAADGFGEAVLLSVPEAELPEVSAPSLPRFVQELNLEYAFVIAGGGHHILWETKDAEGAPRLEHLTESTFHKKLAARTVQIDDSGKRRPATELWMRHPGRRSYDGIVFDPAGRTTSAFYNMWSGFLKCEIVNQAASELALSAYKLHLHENVCGHNVLLSRWLTGFLAHLVQRPWEKPRVAAVFRGKKGTGKTILLEVLRGLLGQHFFLTAHPRYVTGQFNSHLEQCLLFVLDEALWSGDKMGESVLKDLITGTTHHIEHKGKASYAVRNLTRVAIIGNESWLVPASVDERRFAVFDVGEGNRLDHLFFTRMRDGMEQGGARLLFDYLNTFDLSKVDLNSAPSTAALVDQKRLSLSLPLQWFGDSLSNGAPLMAMYDEWPSHMPTSELVQALKAYANSRNARERIPPVDDVIEMIQTACSAVEGKRVSLSERRSRVVAFPDIEVMRDAWARYLGETPTEEGWL